MDTVISQKDIKRDEWIKWEWILVTTQGDGEQKYIKGRERTIEDCITAANQWDFLHAVYISTKESNG
jgi:hypothetical protein